MCAYCQCLLPLLPYYLITLPNVCLLSMLITIINPISLLLYLMCVLIVNAYYLYYPITLLLYLMCAYCQCLLPLLPITLLLYLMCAYCQCLLPLLPITLLL